MPPDSSHSGRDHQDKVIPLGRHTLVAEVEEKLREARHLFSLHDYSACEKIVTAVLKKDPQNARAKALLDLAVIKISNAKQGGKPSAPRAIEEPAAAEEELDVQKHPLATTQDMKKEVVSHRSLPEGERDQGKSEDITKVSDGMNVPREAASQKPLTRKDSLRERTISALVDLFQRKDLSLADWKDPRFRPDDPGGVEEQEGVKQDARTKSGDLNAGLPQSQPAAQPVDTRVDRGSEAIAEVRAAPPVSADSIPRLEPAAKPDYQQWVARKFEQRSEDLRKSEIKTVSIAQIKKYLYQEDYEHCAQELEVIRKLFPENQEIQLFVENTFRRLTELQRIKILERQGSDLMSKATGLYQEGKLAEALYAANEVLQLLPSHQQAKEFVAFVHKRYEKEKKKAMLSDKSRYCWCCGVAVDSISHFCFHCGQRLT